MIINEFYLLTNSGCNYTWNYTELIMKGWQVYIVKNWAPTNLANIRHRKKILNLVFKKRPDFVLKKKVRVILIIRLSIATQLSTNLLFAWIQFSFFDEQINSCIFRYKSMKSVKIDERNECVIDFYRLIDTININQIRFTHFIALSIDKSLPIFIHWLLRVKV